MKITIRCILLLIFIVSGASCSEPTTIIYPDKIPDVGIEPELLNKELSVYAPDGWNNFKTTGPVALIVEANGENSISFLAEDVILFLNDENGNWKEIRNKMKVFPANFEYILDPLESDDPIFIKTTSVLPDLPNENQTVIVRAFVFGYIYKNGETTEEKVGAYTDVVLSP